MVEGTESGGSSREGYRPFLWSVAVALYRWPGMLACFHPQSSVSNFTGHSSSVRVDGPFNKETVQTTFSLL